ncbi:hypothetical protein DID88_009121 [Monilinia fructigena]|uniref:Scaffold protein Nfu/NifU N-terminal domain-containing protein n=1 Tax=Monilinia fructigena TaxID=38457 RepID=A0A395IF64_9HELO|nr:hypothetical protein DID88_009121 [Monilinia fructigena]
MLKPAAIGGSRSIFIQTEDTPNPDALKFLPNHPILPPSLITKSDNSNWAHIKPEVFSLITEAVTSGAQIVNITEKTGASGKAPEEEDSLAYNEDDPEVVGMIKELLETRIRPAIQEDGGTLTIAGSRTNGIEGMLMHYIEEVKGVVQVMDEEEEIALQEFAKFEEKLKQQKGPDTVASSSLDSIPG